MKDGQWLYLFGQLLKYLLAKVILLKFLLLTYRHISLLFLPSFWQGGGMEVGVVAMDVIFAIVYYFVEGKVCIH